VDRGECGRKAEGHGKDGRTAELGPDFIARSKLGPARICLQCSGAVEFTRRDFRAHLLPILLGQCAGLGLGVLGVRLASHWVAPADYGVYGLFVSLTPLGLGVVQAGLLKFVSRHWPEERARLRRGVLRSFWRKTPWLLGAAALVACFVPAPWPLAFPALAVAATALALQALVQTALQAERENWRDFGAGLVASSLRTLLPLALYAGVAAQLGSLLGGFALHAVLAAAAAWLIGGWTRAAADDSADPACRATYEGPRFVVLALAGWIMGASGRSIVLGFFGAEEAGYFTLASNVALVVVSVLFALVQQFVQPRLFVAAGSGTADAPRLARITDATGLAFLLAGVAGLFALAALLPHLVGSLVGPSYAAATRWVLPAGCYHLAILGSTFPHLLLLAARRERACGPPELASALVLLAGAIGTAAWGAEPFRWFALFSPVIPWLTARPLARRALNREAAA